MTTDSDKLDINRRESEMDYRAALADASQRIGIQASIADTAFKALMLVNGGALIALFTFIGSVTQKPAGVAFSAGSIWWAFASFAAALAFALLCHVFAFLSQDNFYNQSMHEAWRHQRAIASGERPSLSAEEQRLYGVGMTHYGFGILSAVASILLFIVGCGFALNGVLLGQP